MKSETEFRKNKVIPFLKTLSNTFFLPIQQLAIVGSPDFLLCMSGQYVALELKSEDGELSKLQAHNLKKMRRTGAVTIVASPLNWDEVKEQLTALDGGKKIWK